MPSLHIAHCSDTHTSGSPGRHLAAIVVRMRCKGFVLINQGGTLDDDDIQFVSG